MKVVSPPNLQREDRPGEDLDRLLRDFFRSEMPSPWPQAPVPAQTREMSERPASRRWLRLHARLALAAAIALFAVGYFFLARSFPDAPERQDSGFVPHLHIGKGPLVPPGREKILTQPPTDFQNGGIIETRSGRKVEIQDHKQTPRELHFGLRFIK